MVDKALKVILISALPLQLLVLADKNRASLQKGGVPATPSGTATLLRLNPSY